MKVKTNLRAGAGSSSTGVKSGGASGAGQNNKVLDVVPTAAQVAAVYAAIQARCTGI